tara:strand:- start:234 stop:1016 length:783 start_codon:yes stop_codon:yes gene_type:complete
MGIRYKKYFSSQALDEGFEPSYPINDDIFYRTDDWTKYKSFKGHTSGNISESQKIRSLRHAKVISNLMSESESVLSLGSGTGILEYELNELCKNVNIVMSDIYDPEMDNKLPCLSLDMTNSNDLKKVFLENKYDTVLISNALSPLKPEELKALITTISQSSVKKIIIYSAEDLRLFNYIKSLVRHFSVKKKGLWLGYLYNSGFINKTLSDNGFSRTLFAQPIEHGILTPIWGSIYLSLHAREANIHINYRDKINCQDLMM